jgi:repressor LexA
VKKKMTVTPKPIDEKTVERLRRFYRANRRLPTYSEMAQLFGYSSKNAAYRLAQKLIDEGFIEKDETGRLVPKGERLGIPLLGYVQAGFPSPAEEELIDTLSLDEFIIDKPEASFMLKVSGDSMRDAGIHRNDLVIVEKGISPKNGDIVLACVDNEWTLKYYEKRGGEVTLVPANPDYPVIKPRGELTLGGVVKAVIRKY